MHFAKKIFFLILSFFVFSIEIFAASKTDTSIFAELKSAYSSGAYPGVIEYAVELETKYPRSLLMPKVFLYKGESLYKLSRFDEALSSLENCINLSEKDSQTLILAYYFSGLSYFAMENYPESQEAFYNSCAAYSNAKNKGKFTEKIDFVYENSIMYAGQAFYKNHQFLNAEHLLENTVCNGKNISKSDYENSILMLFDSYLENEHYDELIKIFLNLKNLLFNQTEQKLAENGESSLNENNLNLCVYYKLALNAGEAYENKKQYKNAYEIYAEVLNGKDPLMASLALQKAYYVASEHKKEVGSEPGEILEKVKENLLGYEDLLAQFWARLALDSYNSGDFKKSVQYFNFCSQNDSEKKYSALQGLYLACIESKTNVEKAISTLNKFYSENLIDENHEYYLDYLNAYSRFYAYDFDWQKCFDCAKIVRESCVQNRKKSYLIDESTFWQSFALYNLSRFKEGLLCIENICPITSQNSNGEKGIWYNANLLYAKLLAKNGYENQSKKMFELIESAGFSSDDRLDYAKILFSNGFVNSSLKQSLRVNSANAEYMSALSYFNTGDYLNAEKLFDEYIKSGNQEKILYAQMYRGYSEYKLNKNQEAYETLIDFASKNKTHSLAFPACITAGNAALELSDLKMASSAAKLSLDCALNQSQKEEALVFCADVYTDAGDFEKAASILKKSSEENSIFGMKSLYKIAQIYEKQRCYDDSDKKYAELASRFSSNELADEASYRRGELYYSAQKYQIAISRFKEYQKKFINGKFLDASYFYIADSYARLSQEDFAIIQYKNLIEFMPKSSYVYNSRKNLAKIYRSQSRYSEALEQIEILIRDFSEAAKKDSLYEQKEELALLASGEDETYVKLQGEYKSKGASSTFSGRISGTDLCEYMWKKDELKEDAFVLALELYSIQADEKNQKREGKYAARTAVILAEYKRAKNSDVESAKLYLEAAKFARGAGEHILAQRALYGAVESFSSGGLKEDARLASESLTELYPGSDYAKNAALLLEE